MDYLVIFIEADNQAVDLAMGIGSGSELFNAFGQGPRTVNYSPFVLAIVLKRFSVGEEYLEPDHGIIPS